MTVPDDVPFAMVNNQFFDEFTDKVRVKPIPWEGYSRAGLISSDELARLKEFQQLAQKEVDARKEEEEERGGGGEEHINLVQYIPLLVGLTEKLTSIDARQYLLVMLDDLVVRGDNVAAVKLLADDMSSVTKTMFRCTEKNDDYLGLKACKIMAGILVGVGLQTSGRATAVRRFAFHRLFLYLEQCMRSDRTSVVDVALQVVQSLLRVQRARAILYNECASCLAQMVDVLRRTTRSGSSLSSATAAAATTSMRPPSGVVAVAQTQYEVVFCLWLLTFEKPIAATLNKKYDVIPVMVDIARSAVKEKVIRIVVETWINMLDDALVAAANVPNMLVAKVPACLTTLSTGRNLKDEDLRASIKQLSDDVAAHTGVMTTWDEYLNEVASGKLEWSPAHRSEQFWKLHVAKMDEHDHRVVRQLAAVLDSPTADETAQSVACHDLSQYVKLNPDGKKLLARIGAKTRIMGLMTSELPEVRYEALMCVQQLMLNAWRK
ncbi:H(+)-transporting V1 sector ATPase subunit H [Coemansia sp. RSA 2399]|nr:H(+)-transporting V1 sector ATPase subunit H [Coemansia sp. RSA 2399]KAJ1905027.1 H(+)-transporting V1 sector ATPase subunit H [Coemansia sp. IMI 209127]